MIHSARFSLQIATAARGDSLGAEPGREDLRSLDDLRVRVRPAAIAVVVDHELAGDPGQIRVEVEERAPQHAVNYDGKPMSLPPVFAASALYDSLLQAALRQFFSRATFETEPIPSLSSDGRLAIEPTSDPSVLTIRWFGSRHVLHVPAKRPFTAHEVQLARAIGAVLAARYRAIFDPKQMLERGDLFRGAIEDRYVGEFLDSTTSAPRRTRAPT